MRATNSSYRLTVFPDAYWAAVSPAQHFTPRLEVPDLLNQGVILRVDSLDFFHDRRRERRTQGFFGVEQLHVSHTFTFKSISGEVDALTGNTVCEGTSPLVTNKDFAILRAVDTAENDYRVHYIVISKEMLRGMKARGELAVADGNAHDAIPGSTDHTLNDENLSGTRTERHRAKEAFNGCGEQCQVVQISQDDR